MCGTPNSENMTFVVTPDKQTFSFDKLRWIQGVEGRDDQYDACHYAFVSRPVGMYESGKIQVTFPQLQNVKIYLNGGTNRTNASMVVVNEPEKNASITK